MNVYTVGQINAYIKNMFSQDYLLHSVIVSGEVSNLKFHSSGHIYFTLKDESGILSAVMFKGNASRMTFKLSDGDHIEAAGYVNIYEASGKYQLYVNSIKKAGAGAQHEELEKLKKKLAEMGMFDPRYKRPIPKYAFTVGVVTSPTGSVIHDIRQVAARRNPGVEIVLCPAKVQGDGAAESVIAGINTLAAGAADVIIIGRGGGSDEDLSAFNDEKLARCIFDCEVPIISAVGHGDDESITDMVADVHAPTPSAAAELAVFLFEEFVRDVSMRQITMERLMGKILDRDRARLKQMTLRMDALSPSSKVKMQRMAYNSRAERLDALMRKRLDATRNKLLIYIEKYKALSPLEKIGHGFAAVTDEHGGRVTEIEKVKKGDLLTLTMREGVIEATAQRIEKRR
ncbi:MAG: exodeoxyribonuclease VII large subunit [Lachnospiraceae bacterium]|nr:exodeoxyribonuclease VII large subunit [Lachnospiraceae bacterium]